MKKEKNRGSERERKIEMIEIERDNDINKEI